MPAAVDVANQAGGINHKGGSFGDTQEAEYAVLAGDFLFRITQQRETKVQLLREATIGRRLVNAYPKNLCARPFKIGKTTLVCREFPRSTRRVGVNVESEDNTVLPPKITEPDEPT